MRIRALNLTAFGPFTDKELLFDKSELYVIYGQNEAGKSSALRGLKALLFGIDERTTDNFIHANSKLRINGCLQKSDGHKIEIGRRKGRNNTLLTPDGEALDEQKLTPYLQGVTAELFGTLFGIDHKELEQGGQNILAQKGEVGQALFSAAQGSQALHDILAHLDEEANGLFKATGSAPKINFAIKTHKELIKETRELSLSSRKWTEHRRAFERTEKDLVEISTELTDQRVEVNRLKRIQRVSPKLTRRSELLLELEEIKDVIVLSADFSKRRQQAVKELDQAQAVLDMAASRVVALRKQLVGAIVIQEILDQSENIENLHSRSGSYSKAQEDRRHLEADRQVSLSEAKNLLNDVRPDLELTNIDLLKPALVKRQRIAELGGKNAVLVSLVEQAEFNKGKTFENLNKARKQLEKLPHLGPVDAIRRTLAAIRKKGDMDLALQTALSELESKKTECSNDLSRLTLWRGELEDVSGLEIPARESILLFEESSGELELRIQRLNDKHEEAAELLQITIQRLDAIQREGEVPTEESLFEARANRDYLWQLLRRQWLDGEDVTVEADPLTESGTLSDAFEGKLLGADELSDRLRRETERVQELAKQQVSKRAEEQKISLFTEQMADCTNEKSQTEREWQDLWAASGIQPRTPREMKVWLDDFERLRDRVRQLIILTQKTADQERDRKTQTELLTQQWSELGKPAVMTETLEPLLLECEHFVDQIDEASQKREKLENEIQTLEASLESLTNHHLAAKAALDTWTAQWVDIVESVGLQGESTPAEVEDFIENVRVLIAKQGDAEQLKIRIEAIGDDAASFQDDVGAIVKNIAPDLAELSSTDAVLRLNSLLSENRSIQTKCLQIEENLEQMELEMRDSESAIQTMNDRLNSLCKEAKCKKHSDLEEIERQSESNLEIRKTISSIEEEVLEIGEGASLAELENEAKSIDQDLLPARIVELNERIDQELEPRRTELAQAKGREEKELEFMDGCDEAASLDEQANALLASIRSDGEKFVRAKLAAKILRDVVERYRKENQGPLIKRASEYFAELTLDSFERLSTEFNERDEPVLTGVRGDGERVRVEGMSSGTRDQLYLALRLASLEKYMNNAEPMPFIVDDVLVDFDDMRSESALTALSELAQKTQVILFTHHSQVVEQAKKLKNSVQILNLA